MRTNFSRFVSLEEFRTSTPKTLIRSYPVDYEYNVLFRPCAVTIAHHFPSSLRGWRRLRSISRCICNSAECEDGRATMNPWGGVRHSWVQRHAWKGTGDNVFGYRLNDSKFISTTLYLFFHFTSQHLTLTLEKNWRRQRRLGWCFIKKYCDSHTRRRQ